MRTIISSLSARYSFDKSYLERIFAKVSPQKKALGLIKPSKPAKSRDLPWDVYRKLFINKGNIDQGRRFIAKHLKSLKKAHQVYGVPPTVIAAIIGVETRYGRNKGTFPVFSTLATLAFENSGRKEFFREELEAFILLSVEQKLSTENLKGSYAGALGIPQFMPSSWRRFAVDFDQNGQTNLITSPEDAIGSVANYLKEHGWEKDLPTHSRALQNPGANPELFFTDELKAEFKYKQLRQHGFKDPFNKMRLNLDVSLVDLRLKNKKVIIWLATTNFFAVTKYNRSYKYAAAVLELAEKLKGEFDPKKY